MPESGRKGTTGLQGPNGKLPERLPPGQERPDWARHVRKHLPLSGIPPVKARIIIAEVAGQLEEAYQEHLSANASPQQAYERTLEHIPDWDSFAASLTEVQRIGRRRNTSRVLRGFRQGRVRWLDDLRLDGLHFVRNMRRHPAFAFLVVLTLALGIGANTAIFSLVNGILLGQLPYSDPDGLVMLWEHNRKMGNPRNVVSPANFYAWSQRSGSFQDFAAYHYRARTMTGRGHPERTLGLNVIGDFFSALRVDPYLGRTFSADPSDFNQVVVSYAFWQSRLGGDEDVLGQTLVLDGQVMSIIGVLKPGPAFPPGPSFWMPSDVSGEFFTSRGRYLRVLARLHDATSLQQAQTEMDAVAALLEREHAEFNLGFGINIVPLREEFAGPLRANLILLQAVVAIVLLIACANVANLLISRVAEREAEFSVRRALGASRNRLFRQMITESTLLAALGGLLGVGLSFSAMELFLAMVPGTIRQTFAIGLDFRVLGFALILTLTFGILTSLLPFLQLRDLRGRGDTGRRSGSRLSDALVVAEVALALVLLVGAGLAIRSLMRLSQVDPGFRAHGLVALSTQLAGSLAGGAEGPEAEAQASFFRQALERIESIPEVESAGAVNFLPVEHGSPSSSFYLLDRPRPQAGQAPVGDILAVAGDYFQTMEIPLLKGRFFDQRDHAGAPKSVIVNQAFVDRFWPHESPLGKRLVLPWNGPQEGEVTGVVGDVRQNGLTREVRPALYWHEPQFTYGFMTFVVRTSRSKSDLTRLIREEIAQIRASVPVFDSQTLDEVLFESVAFARTVNNLLTAFAVLALILAAVGLYGLISRWVARRFHEIGIRMALGAGWNDILRLVVGKAIFLTGMGLVLGLAASALLLQTFRSQIPYVQVGDPLAFAAACLLLLSSAFLASFIPARRAAGFDPLRAVRAD